MFIVVFIILLCFVTMINTSSYDLDDTMSRDHLNPGNALQCFFEAKKLGKPIKFDIVDSTVVGAAIIMMHMGVIGKLYIDPSSDFTTTLECRISDYTLPQVQFL
jgi:hypothetical protein